MGLLLQLQGIFSLPARGSDQVIGGQSCKPPKVSHPQAPRDFGGDSGGFGEDFCLGLSQHGDPYRGKW